MASRMWCVIDFFDDDAHGDFENLVDNWSRLTKNPPNMFAERHGDGTTRIHYNDGYPDHAVEFMRRALKAMGFGEDRFVRMNFSEYRYKDSHYDDLAFSFVIVTAVREYWYNVPDHRLNPGQPLAPDVYDYADSVDLMTRSMDDDG